MSLSAGGLPEGIVHHGREMPEKVALKGANTSLSYAELVRQMDWLAAQFAETRPDAIGLMMDNTPAWVVADLTAIRTSIPLVPIPLFFSPGQVEHLIANSGIELILTDQPGFLLQLLADIDVSVSDQDSFRLAGSTIHAIQLEHPFPCSIPAGVAKITYTSGTTGDPRGVCLSQRSMEDVAGSLLAATRASTNDRHLCILPLATLLENIGGVYVPLMAGATCVLPGLTAVGVSGACGLDPRRLVSALSDARASTCILVPQMLLALVRVLQAGMPKPDTLRFIAVGGAPVASGLLEKAAELELPAYEGYGLSEAASVVAVNGPDGHKAGSVGRPLPHVRLRFDEDGEIMVSGSLFSGYLGQEDPVLQDEFYPTGDTGYLDDDGFLHITGRKKHIFITAFGRNVSPEWVERELTIQPPIAQAAVFGEARPFNVAVLTVDNGVDEQDVQVAVDAANARLPDYARVLRWIRADAPFAIENGLMTGTGRARREAIRNAYEHRIAKLYEDK